MACWKTRRVHQNAERLSHNRSGEPNFGWAGWQQVRDFQKVVSAFATAITKENDIREQLYHARSAAHAYDGLHTDDLEDLNFSSIRRKSELVFEE